MSITTYNTVYFDDLLVSDLNQKTPLDKNYLRILFKPGHSVQVRELNQLQSILQNQIDRLGSSFYREGSAVHGGNISFDPNVKTVDVELNSLYSSSRLANITHLKDQLGLVASVYHYEILEIEGSTATTVRFYLRYNNSIQASDGTNSSVFVTEYTGNGGNSIENSLLEYDIELDDTDETLGAVVNTGYSAALFLSDSIFFIKGSLVHTPRQQKFFNYSQDENEVKSQINGYAYLSYNEYVTNYTSDDTLLDNANGTPNYSAPGADRYTIDLTLDFSNEETFDSLQNTVKLLTIKNSLVLDSLKQRYTELDRTLAQRTFEESGNYTVSKFDITVREFYNDLSNGGRYQVSEIPQEIYTDSEQPEDIIAKAKDLYSLSLDPSVAYVSGYRIEPVEKQEMYISKARGASHISQEASVSASATVGNYVIGSFSVDSPLPIVQNALGVYDLINSAAAVIGTCRIRAIESTSTSGEYACFLYDIKMSGNNRFSSTVAIKNVSFTPDFVFNLDSDFGAAIFDAQNFSSTFLLPYSTIQNVSDLEYYTLRTVTDTATTFSLTDPNETFADTTNTIARLTDGTIVAQSPELSPDAKTITFDQAVTSACLKIKIKSGVGNSRLKTKTKTTAANAISPVNGIYTLVHSDILKLVKVTVTNASGADVTRYCRLTSDGQHPTHYSNATVEYTGPALTAPATLWFEYDYLAHGSGDYFTVNSYANISYSDIPSYEGVRLSDVYDFRPLILAGASSATITAIDPNSVFEANVKYYLPRKDSVVVNPAGEFSIVRGEASLKPIEPAIARDSMLLYTLDIPAYTFSASDIKITPIDNRRYTMRDIGGLAKRINNLEYYTSLSLLERNAMDKRIIDPSTATERFKNGILVDSFYNHAVGDTFNSGYACAVDTVNGGLSPKQLAKSTRIKIVSLDNLREHAHGITLDYEERPLISQLYASETISVNPYDVAVFTGSLSLLPSTDDWKDTITAPDIIVNDSGAYDAMLLASQRNPNMFGTVAGEWTNNWTGRSVRLGRWDFTRSRTWGQWRERITTLTGTRTRELITTSLGSETTTQSLGENIIDTSYIPYIRSRKIYFTGIGLKPNTRVYAFFDNIDVTGYCNQLNGVPAINFDKIDDSSVELFTNIDSTNTLFFKNAPLITDSAGKIYGEFIIPNNSIHKFKTGERTLRLTSSPRNLNTEAETVANGNYIASGTTVTVQETILSITRPVVNTTTRLQTEAARQTVVDWFDPLAQSFVIPEIEEGIFATSVDIFFAQKSASLPVTLQIVTVENGIPTQKIVPFSKVVLDASAVAIDPNRGQIATNFKFSDPVYLRHGVEYAIVLLSNDSTYRVWIATVGGTNVATNTFISKNVYGGVFFTSQNASTWTPEQNRDLKFVLNRAEFNTTGTAIHTSSIAGRLSDIQVGVSGSGYTTAPLVTIAAPGVTASATAVLQNGGVTSFTNISGGTNYNAAPFVTIGAPTGSGEKRQARAVAFINSLGTVYKISTANVDGGDPGLGYVSIPTVTIDPPGITATAVASIDPITNGVSEIEIVTPGSNYRTAPAVTIAPPTSGTPATATANIDEVVFSGFNLNQTALVPQKTSLVNSIVNSNETYDGVELNTNYNLTAEYNITVEDQIQVTNVLSTTSPYVSPMLDIERKSIICFRNEVNNFDVYETTSDDGIGTRTIVDASDIVAGKTYTILTVGATATNWVDIGAANSNIGTTFIANAVAPTGNGTAYLEPVINYTPGARYITKPVVLNNSADRLNIYLDINRPVVSTDVKVYVKFGESTSWTLVEPSQPIAVNSDDDSYSEVSYIATDSDKEFTRFTVKIVMLSSNPAFVPRIKDMRVIATI